MDGCEAGVADDGGEAWADAGDDCVVGAAGGLVVDVAPAAGCVSGLVVGVAAVVVGADGLVAGAGGTIGLVVGTGALVVGVGGFVGTEGWVVETGGLVVDVVDGRAGLVVGDVGVVVGVGGPVVGVVVGTGGVVDVVVVEVGAVVVVVVGLVVVVVGGGTVVGGTVVGGTVVGGGAGGTAKVLITARVVSAVIVSVGGVACPSYVTVSPGGISSSLPVHSAPIGTVVAWSSPDDSMKEASAGGSWTGTVPAVLVSSQVTLKL